MQANVLTLQRPTSSRDAYLAGVEENSEGYLDIRIDVSMRCHPRHFHQVIRQRLMPFHLSYVRRSLCGRIFARVLKDTDPLF